MSQGQARAKVPSFMQAMRWIYGRHVRLVFGYGMQAS